MVSYVINELLLNQPDLKCGCRCREYSTPDGLSKWSITDPSPLVTRVNSLGQTVYRNPLLDSRGNSYDWFFGQLTCSGGYDTNVCGSAFSEAKNSVFCSNTNPRRWVPALSVPNPPYRPASGSLAPGIVDDRTNNETWSADGQDDTDQGFYGQAAYSRPSPYLYTSAASSTQLASDLTSSMLFDNVSQFALLNIYNTVLVPALPFNGSFGLRLLASLQLTLGPLVDYDLTRSVETLPLKPFQPLLFGSAQEQQQGSLQNDPAFRGKPLKFMATDCRTVSWAVRGNLTILGRIFGSDMSCVSMPGVPVATVAAMNAALFTGYGAGAPGAVGSGGTLAAFPFAVDFGTSNSALGSGALRTTVYYNGTLIKNSGPPYQTFHRINSVLNRLSNAFLNRMVGTPAGPNGLMKFNLRYLRDMPSQGVSIKLDVGTFLGPLFYTWLAQMLLPVMVGLLVYEKEKNLRTMMKIQGLGDSAYMLVNYIYYFLLYFAFMLLIYFYGYVLGRGTNSLNMWTRSDAGPVIIFFILFINVQISIAFLFQALFNSAKTATVGSVVYLLVSGLLGRFLFESFLESSSFGRRGIVGMELLVPFSLYRGFYEMAAFGQVASFVPEGTGESSTGLSWKKLSGSAGMDDVMVIFFVEWLLIGCAAWYLDQVYSSGSGIKRHPLFFLDCLLKRQLRERQERLAAAAEVAAHDAAVVETDAPDVRACREAAYSVAPGDTFILARGLSKTYPGQDGAPPKVACRELSVSIPAGECFGLLGPNGAGKSTAINLLIGFLQPTRGAAYVQGFNLQHDLDTVYTMLGVCPQHDLLWEQLTAREHLRFYGRLKNLGGAGLELACDQALQGVNLFHGGVGDRPCGTYSGGMKRRLSVAISLLGNPPVVFLDEPSTGLDPASRATLWEVIKEAKKQRAIVLTTHAMEEAEELCDRLGIFVDGQLRCVGNPKELTSRYGGFLVLTLTATPLRVPEVEAFVRRLSPNSILTYKLGGTLKYDLPLQEVSLAGIFAAVTDSKAALGIVDWGVANMTLEEVFIKLARDTFAGKTEE